MPHLPPREQRHPFLRYQGLEFSDYDIVDFKERLDRIHNRGTHRVQVLDFEGMPKLMRNVLGPLVRELILVFLSMLRFREVLLDLDASGTIQFQLGGAKRHLSWREFILALGLHTGEEMESLSFVRRFAAGRKSRALLSGPTRKEVMYEELLRRLRWHHEGKKIARLEVEVHGMRKVLQVQRESTRDAPDRGPTMPSLL
nr:hypothetical protein [Tanacetum cinerariifolium]